MDPNSTSQKPPRERRTMNWIVVAVGAQESLQDLLQDPNEYANHGDALAGAKRLAKENPGEAYQCIGLGKTVAVKTRQVSSFLVD